MRRHSLGMTQGELARALNVSQAFVSALERGAKEPSLEMLERVAAILNFESSDLLRKPAQITDSSRRAYQSGLEGARAILAEYDAPPGLRALASDEALIAALNISSDEWNALRSVPFDGIKREGYVQILMIFRSVVSS